MSQPIAQQPQQVNTGVMRRVQPILDAIGNSAKNLTGNPDLSYNRDTQQGTQSDYGQNPLIMRLQPILNAIGGDFNKTVDYVRQSVTSIDPQVLAQAFVQQESGGDYNATSTFSDSNGVHAYGKYQILGSNIPSWTKQVLGKSFTPKQFLADPKAQDAVFQWHLKNLVNKYGNIRDVASAYFSGGSYEKNKDKKDKSGKTVAQYASELEKKYQQIHSKSQTASAASTLQ